MTRPKIYKIDRDKYMAEDRKSGMRILLMVVVTSIMFGLFLGFTSASSRISLCHPCTISAVLSGSISFFLFLIIFPGSIIIYLRRRNRRMIDKFELELTHDYLILRKPEANDLYLNKNEITRIKSNVTGIFLFKGRKQVVVIPTILNNFGEAKSIFESWSVITPVNRYAGIRNLIRDTVLILLLVFYLLTRSPILLLLGGAAIIIYIIRGAKKTWNRETIKKSAIFLGVFIGSLSFFYIATRILRLLK